MAVVLSEDKLDEIAQWAVSQAMRDRKKPNWKRLPYLDEWCDLIPSRTRSEAFIRAGYRPPAEHIKFWLESHKNDGNDPLIIALERHGWI